MTGREKLLSSFTPEGAAEIGVVASYDGLFLRDHYAYLTRIPWWDSTRAGEMAADFHAASGLEWFTVRACAPREQRAREWHEERADGVWRIDALTGEATRLREPVSGGTNTECAHSRHTMVDALPATRDDVDALIQIQPPFDRDRFLAEGRQDAALAVRASSSAT